MLLELRVRELGVIEDVTVVFAGGMTALTGETGAGKTLLVDAIQLLMGGPADSSLVRPGASEAIVEARFAGLGEEERVMARVIPAQGRSRAYIDGRMVPASQLSEVGSALVDLHGQHAHQSLLSPSAQRAALDTFAGISTAEVAEARRRVREIKGLLDALGGDQRSRLRELEMLRYQLDELDAAGLDDPDEDEALKLEEEILGDAAGLRLAAGEAWEAMTGDGGVADSLGAVVALLSGRGPLSSLRTRLTGTQEELADVAAELRAFTESVDDDPERLAEVGARRKVLSDLRKKYGDSLGEVIDYREEVRDRVGELDSFEERASALETELGEAQSELSGATERLWRARQAAAGDLGRAVQSRLAELAMAKARFEVTVGDTPGSEDVTWMLGANPGEAVLPLAKVASGGELARAMLATRLAIGAYGEPAAPDDDPSGEHARQVVTLVFDEVDAGIGGEAAVTVGQALASLGRDNQVLVVTHLAQVASCADRQIVVSKASEGDRTVAQVRSVDGAGRVVELARMLSGNPDSATARRHAEELLSQSRKAERQSAR